MELTNLMITPPVARKEAIDAKWGRAISAGFVAVPNALIKYQSALNISQNELAVIMNLLLHWWYKDKLPFPATSTISERSGLEVRTVQRSLQSLKAKQLVEKIKYGNKFVYSLDGLRLQLEMYAESDLWNLSKNSKSSNVVEKG